MTFAKVISRRLSKRVDAGERAVRPMTFARVVIARRLPKRERRLGERLGR